MYYSDLRRAAQLDATKGDKTGIDYMEYLKDGRKAGRPKKSHYKNSLVGKPVKINSMPLPVYGMPKDTLKSKLTIIFFAGILAILILELLTLRAIEEITEFHDKYYMATHPIISTVKEDRSFSLKFSQPVTIEEREYPREIMSPLVYAQEVEEVEINELTKDLEGDKKEIGDYIVEVFGDHAHVALAVAKAESGLNCSALNVNTNGTVDFSVMQVNSIHMKKGYKLSELTDCKRNVDIAYEIFQSHGNSFNPWVAFTNGSFGKFYK
jgi:hypothetical protein